MGRGAPRLREGESGASVVWRMSGGEWGLVMGGGCCVGTAAWEQAMLLVMVRGLQRIGAVAAVVLTLVMVPCGGVPVAMGVGWGSCREGRAVGCTWLVPFGSASVRLPLRTRGHQCVGGCDW